MISAVEPVEDKYQTHTEINALNTATKQQPPRMEEKFKPVSNIYDGQYFNILTRDNDILIVR